MATKTCEDNVQSVNMGSEGKGEYEVRGRPEKRKIRRKAAVVLLQKGGFDDFSIRTTSLWSKETSRGTVKVKEKWDRKESWAHGKKKNLGPS